MKGLPTGNHSVLFQYQTNSTHKQFSTPKYKKNDQQIFLKKMKVISLLN